MQLSRQVWVAVAALAVLGLAGCASEQPYPQLPESGAISQKLLTPEEQAAKIKALASAGADASGSVQPAVVTDPAPAQ
jgi:outer membrane murein-binding lipoprotein Lpp